jgi:hypothetical protein
MTIKNDISPKKVEPQKAGFRWLVLIGLLFIELLVYTWVRTESTQTILRVSKARAEHIKKTSYGKALSVERDWLKSDERITRIAKNLLDLSVDTLEQTIYISDFISGEDG